MFFATYITLEHYIQILKLQQQSNYLSWTTELVLNPEGRTSIYSTASVLLLLHIFFATSKLKL